MVRRGLAPLAKRDVPWNNSPVHSGERLGFALRLTQQTKAEVTEKEDEKP